ncbi:unnamed protein product [Rotaria socialis]|uniref:Uncharacterized protein n=1 Tax=Rotaria socialis TaxID=392032 RepID=A0A818SI20_9BILA|nr:unnamed protein product [Rotaria socialis]CAF4458031.1 unnamed protein product [Rotaria socialis]
MARISSDVSLLIQSTPSLSSISFPLYRRRFYVLFVFGFLAFNQYLFWLTFSPISQSTQAYYHITESTINLLLNWGSIIFIPCLPLTYVLLNKPHGLRKCVIILAITDLLATILRIVPSMIVSPSNDNFTSVSLFFIHVGQILNAACGPLVMAPVSQLSCIWFGTNERTRATTFAIVAPSFGSTIGFLISPWIVNTPERVPQLLYIHLSLALVPCVLIMIYFPAQPPRAPSPAAQSLIDGSIHESNIDSLKTYMKNLRQCFTTPSFLLLCSVGGLLGGAFSAWTSLFANILALENFTERQSGWFGFGASLAAITGGLCVSTLADTRYFRRSFKSLIITMTIGFFIALVWFDLLIRTVFYDEPILKPTVTTVIVSVTLAGLFQGSAAPLVYEALAEIMFPLPESLSASVLVQFANIAVLILLLIPPSLYQWMNLLVLAAIGSCILMMGFVHIEYKRRNEDERKQ